MHTLDHQGGGVFDAAVLGVDHEVIAQGVVGIAGEVGADEVVAVSVRFVDESARLLGVDVAHLGHAGDADGLGGHNAHALGFGRNAGRRPSDGQGVALIGDAPNHEYECSEVAAAERQNTIQAV